MADRVEIVFRGAAARCIPRKIGVLVAVSGGGDSVALLHLLARAASGLGVTLAAAHLDHGLRKGSPGDRRWVAALAAGMGIPCVTARRSVKRLRRRGESPEEAARRIRREFLLEAAHRTGAAVIALGHTLDDQAETVLMRLVRGAGPSALAGMDETGPGPFVRPLLGLERAEVRRWLRRRRIPFLEDPSNDDPRFTRNRVRNEVLPLLASALNPRAARHLVEAARRLRADADYLEALASSAVDRAAIRRGRTLSLSAATIAEAPLPLASRMARAALVRAGSDPRRVATRHLEALIRLARGPAGKSLDLPGRVRGIRRGARLVLVRPEPTG